jgi:hypothetical protein
MKIILTESQYNRLFEDKKEILHIPSLIYFNNDWNTLQRFLQLKGNPLYSIGGRLDLFNTPIKSLGNLTSVGGYLDLRNTPIESLGNLTSVEGDLDLVNTPISKKYTENQIRDIINIEGNIYM